MNNLIEAYIEDHKNAWAASTLRSEHHRLRAVGAHIASGSPESFWEALETGGYGKYSRTTLWTRVVSFYDWLIENGHRQGPNQYRAWRKKNARLFKHAYQRKFPELSFEEARARIESIPDGQVRALGLLLLDGGLRYSEAATLRDGEVIGKGGKPRRVFTDRTAEYSRSYSTFWRSLRHFTNLSPHQLRKLRAVELRRRGMRDEDMCKVFGWSSFMTAQSYLAPKRDEEIQAIVGQ